MGILTARMSPPAWRLSIRSVLVAVVVLGVTFQICHFVEHAVQFGMWVFGDRSAPWMSGPAMWLVHLIGNFVMPVPHNNLHTAAFSAQQMMVGMEVLHLIGNSIFLVTIACLYVLLPTKWVRWALYIESFHLCEHLMLTTSAIFLGKPLGFSTLFGYSGLFWFKEGMVGYRVFWHFAMNLIPTVLVMVALMPRKRLAKHSAFA